MVDGQGYDICCRCRRRLDLTLLVSEYICRECVEIIIAEIRAKWREDDDDERQRH